MTDDELTHNIQLNRCVAINRSDDDGEEMLLYYMTSEAPNLTKMTKPKLTPVTLYIYRDQDVLSGEKRQYVKIGIVRNDKEAGMLCNKSINKSINNL